MAEEASIVDEGAPHGPSPYEPLWDHIIQYSSQGEVFLVGDFNARTQSRQCTIFQMDKNLEMVNVDLLALAKHVHQRIKVRTPQALAIIYLNLEANTI